MIHLADECICSGCWRGEYPGFSTNVLNRSAKMIGNCSRDKLSVCMIQSSHIYTLNYKCNENEIVKRNTKSKYCKH